MAPNGSIDAALRAQVRKELEWEGFAMLAPGLLAHPAADRDSLAEMLRRIDGAGKDLRVQRARTAGRGRAAAGELVAGRLGSVRRDDGLPPLHRRVPPLLALLAGTGHRAAAGLRDAQPADPRLPPRAAARPDAAAGAAARGVAGGGSVWAGAGDLPAGVCAGGGSI
jgi:hypothetical protein